MTKTNNVKELLKRKGVSNPAHLPETRKLSQALTKKAKRNRIYQNVDLTDPPLSKAKNDRKKSSNVEDITKVCPIGTDQQRILEYLVDYRTNPGAIKTQKISGNDFKKDLGIPLESARTAIKRLINSGKIKRQSFQRGRAGWTVFCVKEAGYRQLIDARKRTG